MTKDRALILAVGSFVLFTGLVLLLFAMLDIRPLLSIGPIVAVAIASAGVFVAARDERA